MLKNSHTRPTPDYLWNDKLWELKTPKSTNGSDKLIHRGIHQIAVIPGGILVDCSDGNVNTKKVIEIATRRLQRSKHGRSITIIVRDGNEVVAILK